MSRREHELSPAFLAALRAASLIEDQAERQRATNKIWEALARARGFDYTTVQPVEGKGEEWFSAEDVIEGAASVLVLSPPLTTLAEYSKLEAGLAELRGRLSKVVHDLTTTKGMDEARADRRECVRLRTSLEAVRKELKAPALERSRRIDSEAAALTAAILELEQPIDARIQADEKRKADEKVAKAKAELARVTAIRGEITELQRKPAAALNLSAADIATIRSELEATRESEEWAAAFQEFLPEAIGAREAALAFLADLEARKRESEAEAARIAAAAAALAEQQAAAERERVARELQDKLARDAEEAKQAAARKEIEDREAAVAAEEKRQREAREAAEREAARQAEETAARARHEAAEKEREQARERERQEAAERAREHRRQRIAKRAHVLEQYDPVSALTAILRICDDESLSDEAARDQCRLFGEAFVLGAVDHCQEEPCTASSS